MKQMPPAVLALIALLLPPAAITAEHWPQFRGTMAGVADDDPRLPDSWSPSENVAWVAEVPGAGWSSPVVWGDQVFVTTVVNSAAQEAARPGFYLGDWPAPSSPHRWMVYSFDVATGAVRWSREVGGAPPERAKHLKNSYASETPVTDGDGLYAYFGNLGLFAFDLDGTPRWSVPMGPFQTRNNWGTGASPALHGDRLYIVNDNDQQSFLAAFDTRTGKEVWRVDREEGTNWSTPFVWEHEQGVEIVTVGSDKVRSYDTSGRLLWELTGMSTISIPTPFARHGLLYLSSGYIADPQRPAYAIRPGARGDITLARGETSNGHIVWALPTGAPYNPTPLVYGDIYYTLFDRGFFTTHDARTGEPIYPRQRVATDATAFTASPWAYNGHIFSLSEDGTTYVVSAGREFRVVGRNDLAEMTLATPAIADGSLYIRTASKLYRFTRRTP